MERDSTVPMARIVVSQPFADSVGPEAVQTWAKIVVEAAEGRHHDTPTMTDFLTARFADAGLAVSPMEVERLAERLADPDRGGVEVATNDGLVLAATDVAVVEPNPAGQGNAGTRAGGNTGQLEPADPDRPVYS